MTDQNPPSQPAFNPDAAHQVRPRLRKIRTFPMPVKGPDGQQQVVLGLADAQQISGKVVATHPAVQHLLPLMDGTRSVDQIVGEVGRGLTIEAMQSLVAQLDDAALIQGPTFEALETSMRADFDASETLPPATTAQFADALVMQKMGQEATDEQKAEHGPGLIREVFDQWMDKALENADNPTFDELPVAIVAPGNEYARSWINYAAVWGRLRVADRPDRVVILGANHFGSSTGVCGCDKSFESPLGSCALDAGFKAALDEKLGKENAEKLYANRFDHEREHSIELQIPWIQHALGAGEDGSFVPVYGALVHDPAQNAGESYDGQGVGLEVFVGALKDAIASVGGRTLIVASADLSHVGPAFGDAQALSGDTPEAAEARNNVAKQDQELLKMLVEGKADDVVSSIAWQQNPTRWSSTGALVAAAKASGASRGQVLNYAASMDQQGSAMLTNAAAAMFA